MYVSVAPSPILECSHIVKVAVVNSQQMDALLQVTEKVIRVMNRGITYETDRYPGPDSATPELKYH